MGQVIWGPTSRRSVMKSRPGKNPLVTTGSRYPAVSRAETTSTASPAMPNARSGASIPAVSRYHLLTKPAMGGIPIRDSDARVKHHMVTGIRRPMPRSWSTRV